MTLRAVAKKALPNRVRSQVNSVLRKFAHSTSGSRVLPDFLLIGAQKAGTSSLYFYLQQHPNVILPVAITKETHYFDLNFLKGESWYRGHFPRRVAMRAAAARKGVAMTFEATPEYIVYPRAAERIARILPDTKAVLTLRNPIDRAFSHYNMQVLRTLEGLSFEDALDAECERIEPHYERILRDPEHVGIEFLQFGYTRRGIYVDQIENWHRHHKPENLLVIEMGEIQRDPVATFRKVQRFLGLPTFDDAILENINPGNYVTRKIEMKPETRERLRNFFRSHNQRLYDYLGVDYGWR